MVMPDLKHHNPDLKHHHPGHGPGHEQRHQRPHAPRHAVQACHVACSAGPGDATQELHVNDAHYTLDFGWHHDPLWILDHHHWVRSGELHVMFEGVVQQDDQLGLSWGRFTITDSDVGDFEGTWSWDWLHGADGHGYGGGTGASAGRTIQVTFLYEDPDDLPAPPQRPCAPLTDLEGFGYLRLATT